MKKIKLKTKQLIVLFLIQILSNTQIIAQTVYFDNSTNLYGIIDRNGKDILKPTFKQMSYFDIENGLSVFEDNNKWGLINKRGIVVLKAEFDDVYSFPYVGFSEGLISAKKNGKYGYYDLTNNIVIPNSYDEALPFCQGIAAVRIKEKYFFINKKEVHITDKQFDNVKIIDGKTYGIDEKRVYDSTGAYSSGEETYYLINKDSNVTLAENQIHIDKFDSSGMDCCGKELIFSENLIPFFDDSIRLYGYKNKKNEIVQKAKYNIATPFTEGFTIVMLPNLNVEKKANSSKGKFLIINDKFETVKILDGKYDDFYSMTAVFQNGLCGFKALISKPSDEVEVYEYVLINKNGEIIKRMKREPLSPFVVYN